MHCKHGSTYRTAIQTLFYRPILSLIIDLIQTSGFIASLRYNFVKSEDPNCRFADLRDGVHAQEHERAMHTRYEAYQAGHKDQKLIEISLLLSMFYDGAQVYKSKVSNFWPLYISILNLAPLYRNKVGVGMFMLSLYTGKAGADVEKFLLEKCFMDEMHAMHAGVVYEFNQNTYYIQARTIQYCYDTKALGKELNVQEAGSLAGCPLCKSGKGVRRETLEKVCYNDLRNVLPMEHILRYSGSSRACCPSNYYVLKESLMTAAIEQGANDPKHTLHHRYQTIFRNRAKLATTPRYLDPTCGPCDNNMHSSFFQKALQTNLKDEPVWFHTAPYSFSEFKDVIWYEHCDLRRVEPIVRKSMAAFVALGNRAA